MHVTIVGNVTDDPELRFTPSGAAVANFTVAENRRRMNRQTNEWEDAGTTFVQCAVWREAAENVAESFAKGMRVIVTGELFSENYDRQDGSRGTSVKMTVNECGPSIRFATTKTARNPQRGNGQGGQGAPSGQQGNPWGAQPQGQPQGGQQGNGWGSQPQRGGGDPWGTPGNAQDDPPF